MLNKFKMSHLQGFVLFLFIASVATTLLYYYLIIDQASTYSAEQYQCGSAFPVQNLNTTINSSEQAQNTAHAYLSDHNISISKERLAVSSINELFRVSIPNELYEGRECTFRNQGAPPPECIGQWFQLNNSELSMRYQIPCQ